jgi:hypothetical protein
MSAKSSNTLRIMRGLLWAAVFYVLAILLKIYYNAETGLNNSVHILGLGIFFGSLCVVAILKQSRREEDNKQARHLVSATVLLTILYCLCALLAFAFFGTWMLPYV